MCQKFSKKSIRTYWVWQFVRVCNFCFLFSPHLLHNKYFLSCMVIRIPITKNQIWQDCNLSWQRSQEGPRPISQTLISSFVQGGTGWALWNDLQQIWALNIWQEEIHATDVKTWELLTMHSDKHSRYKPQKGGSQEQWVLKPQSWMLVAEIERFYQWLEMTG